MRDLAGYLTTSHFEEQIKKRHFDDLILSLCIVKGFVEKQNKHKCKFVLHKNQIIEIAKQCHMPLSKYVGLIKLTVVIERKRLVTAYARYGDTGIFQCE